MAANTRSVFEITHISPEQVKTSQKWFNDQVAAIAKRKINPQRIMTGQADRLTNRVVPGRPMFFFYDPKGKDTLPYYDTFPLVIPFAKTENGFLGLNLHYLDYKPRMMLFRELYKIYTVNKKNESATIQYSWNLIKGVAKMSAAQPCIKQYLTAHVRSAYYNIPPDDWHTAVMLPVQRFVGASKEQVWRESARKAASW